MSLLRILLYIMAFIGFAILVALSYDSRDDFPCLAAFAPIPLSSVIVWFILPAYRIWVIYLNVLAFTFFAGVVLWLEFGQKIYWHFKLKKLCHYFECEEETEKFKQLYEKINKIVYFERGQAISHKDCFRFYMLKIEAGKLDAENEIGIIKQIVRKAKISRQEYEKYRDTVEALESKHCGRLYAYGTDRDGCSVSGVSDKVRFKPRILS